MLNILSRHKLFFKWRSSKLLTFIKDKVLAVDLVRMQNEEWTG